MSTSTYPNAKEVYLCGSFDNWTGKYRMEKDSTNSGFSISLELPAEKVYYKFVVDGMWKTSSKGLQECNSSGIWNNVLYPEEIACSSDEDRFSEYTSISFPSGSNENSCRTNELHQEVSSICDNIVQVNEENLSTSVQITLNDDNSVTTKTDLTSDGSRTPQSRMSFDRSKAPRNAVKKTILFRLKSLFIT